MSAHEWVALVTFGLSEDAVAQLVDDSSAQIHLDHENRRSIVVGCMRCEIEYPKIRPGSECLGSWRELEPGDRVVLAWENEPERSVNARVLTVEPEFLRVDCLTGPQRGPILIPSGVMSAGQIQIRKVAPA